MNEKLIALIIIGVGLLFLGPATVMGVSLWSFLQDADFTQGKVIALTPGDSGLEAPKVAFQTAGHFYTFQSNTYGVQRYHMGDEVEVIFAATNPQNAAVYNIIDTWGASILFGILGTPFFLIGLFMLVKSLFHPGPRYRYSPP